ncbi:MAG: bifunctional methylenetetrahydrofolate dehydrogenase/methenyltetrahydrofolate cyclohydrolase FolD [Proteobacteria bacterium]|nr:bifunctional methylenetetrahydrofolate dehydrogenase/methenyltetrahydrofolate cyclohydrolase FolD [Pseudomonadota bacterium]
MSARIIDGKAFAANLTSRIGDIVKAAMAKGATQPGLAVVLVGNDAASEVYVRNKIRTTEASGMASIEHRLPVSTSQDELLTLIDTLNKDDAIDGILVQLPLPEQINADAVINAISPEKDVDGFHVVNVGRLWAGLPSLVPCTPYGSLLLLKDALGDLSGMNAVVVGRSNIVGKPMAQLLLSENCTVTIAHSRSKDLPAICREADIIVAAVGHPDMVKGDWIKPGAVVIDVGINRIETPERGEGKTRLTGDVDFNEAKAIASAITPVPGGVGPMTIACLLRNTLVAASRRHGFSLPKDII